jgi:hypothetical protein
MPAKLHGRQAAAQAASSKRDEATRVALPSRIGSAAARAILAAAMAISTVSCATSAGDTYSAAMSLARCQIGVGLTEDAKASLAVAADARDRFENSENNVLELGSIAELQIEVGAFADAVKSATRIRNRVWRPKYLLRIAAAQTRAKLYADAFDTINRLEGAHPSLDDESLLDSVDVYDVLGEIARGQANAGMYAGALATADKIEDGNGKPKILAAIATAQAKVGLAHDAGLTFADAIRSAGRIRDLEREGGSSTGCRCSAGKGWPYW